MSLSKNKTGACDKANKFAAYNAAYESARLDPRLLSRLLGDTKGPAYDSRNFHNVNSKRGGRPKK